MEQENTQLMRLPVRPTSDSSRYVCPLIASTVASVISSVRKASLIAFGLCVEWILGVVGAKLLDDGGHHALLSTTPTDCGQLTQLTLIPLLLQLVEVPLVVVVFVGLSFVRRIRHSVVLCAQSRNGLVALAAPTTGQGEVTVLSLCVQVVVCPVVVRAELLTLARRLEASFAVCLGVDGCVVVVISVVVVIFGTTLAAA